jgi:hypothetical protein
VPGDALADLRSFQEVAFVMKGGTVYKQPKSPETERARR